MLTYDVSRAERMMVINVEEPDARRRPEVVVSDGKGKDARRVVVAGEGGGHQVFRVDGDALQRKQGPVVGGVRDGRQGHPIGIESSRMKVERLHFPEMSTDGPQVHDEVDAAVGDGMDGLSVVRDGVAQDLRPSLTR